MAGDLDEEALRAELADLDPAETDRALERVLQNGWVSELEGVYSLNAGEVRSLVSDDVDRRIDGINHQMEIFADSVWGRFAVDAVEQASGRSWVFAARPEEFTRFIDSTVRQLRHDAVELEETALAQGDHTRFGVTVAFAPIQEEQK